LSYAWHNDLCFPGQDRLARDMGMGVASVNRFVKELEEATLIEITRRGQGKTNFYTINFVVKKKGGKS
jgi:predicted transcriptional regulator